MYTVKMYRTDGRHSFYSYYIMDDEKVLHKDSFSNSADSLKLRLFFLLEKKANMKISRVGRSWESGKYELEGKFDCDDELAKLIMKFDKINLKKNKEIANRILNTIEEKI